MRYVLAVTAVLMLAAPAFAEAASGETPAVTAAATAEGAGQIKSFDLKAGTVTIHHAPIAALGWPAMTMTFKAAPEVLQQAKIGQTVTFTLKGPDNEVVAIRPR